MNRNRTSAIWALMLACGLGVATAPAVLAEPSGEDQVFFDDLQQQGLRPNYDKAVCENNRCQPLRDRLVQEGHEVCVDLGDAPRLVPVSVIADLQVTPNDAHAIINAARHAYCAQMPDPYSRYYS